MKIETEERGREVVLDTITKIRDKWPEEWREQVSLDVLVKAFPPQVSLVGVEEERIRKDLAMVLSLTVEFRLSMQRVIACREGKHPSCIDGQPYDPRYQYPSTLPLPKEQRSL